MKQIILPLCLLLSVVLKAQTTLVLRPDTSTNFTSQIIDYPGTLNNNYGFSTVMAAHVWNVSSTTWHMRSLIKFDLSSIPANAIILSASMDLYADDSTTTFSGNPPTPMNGNNNACTVKRILQPWNNFTVNWNNQPSDTALNQVILPTSINNGQDYLGTDVKQLVQDQILYGNYGFKIQPITTVPNNSMVFRTGKHADPNSRPRLTVEYTTPNLVLNLGADRTNCPGSTIILDAHRNGGFAPFTYAWQSTGDALSCANCVNPSVTLTQNSTFIVSVTDANNTTTADTIEYTLTGGANQLQASFVNTNISCGQPVDTTTASISNAVLPVTYNWGDGFSSTGSANAIHHYQQSGIYIIQVSDSTGCSISVFDTITNSTVGVTLAEAIRPVCAYDSSGSISITPTGGTAPYQYHWITGVSDSSLTNISSGSYSVTVTDQTGCSSLFYHNLAPTSDVFNYYVYLTSHDANCGNTGSVLADVHNGIPPYKYLWSNGDTTQNIINLPGAVYSLTVSDSSGCKRRGHAEVDAYCASYIRGFVLIDTNQNCLVDSGELTMRSVFITATGNGHSYYGISNTVGAYSITVPDTGTYSIRASVWSSVACTNISLCNNPSGNVTIAHLGDSSLNNNFVAAISNGYDLAIHPGWTNSNPGFQKEYWILPYNESYINFTGPATVTMFYDSLLTYQYSMAPLPVHDPVAHSLTWTVASVSSPSWNWLSGRLRSFFNVPLTLSLGDLLHTSFYISPTSGDCDSSNNSFVSSEIVTGSLDPNEKDVEPANRIAPEDSLLRYTIHFQNCGTDSTHFVIIKDTLSDLLDPTTVRTVASSHPYSEFNVSGTGILTWVFNPLRLVDSLTNPRGSQGFVSFTIEKKKSLPLGTVLSNTAFIYFDYNVPVQTNTVTDTVAIEPTNYVANLSANNKNQLFIFPNPSNDIVNILYSSPNVYDVAVYDLLGRMVYEKRGKRNQTTLNLNGMARGTYLVKITDKSDSSTITKRVVLQ